MSLVRRVGNLLRDGETLIVYKFLHSIHSTVQIWKITFDLSIDNQLTARIHFLNGMQIIYADIRKSCRSRIN